MATKTPMTVEKSARDLLETRVPTRIAVFLRRKSPLYSAPHQQVVFDTCSILQVPSEESRLIAVQKWPQLDILVFEVFHDAYDPKTAHHKADLPVLLVDYGKASSVAKNVSLEFRGTINKHVASQHNLHGWDAEPPFIEDHTSPGPRKYENPRDTTLLP
ncbi:hypothetical protein F5B19DRAFT_372720 [Rostrohypoxylon terebratum]|nr:hypothetical protein F5B19DRAFT_372720 [Rostrohypoxylon terebratum]